MDNKSNIDNQKKADKNLWNLWLQLVYLWFFATVVFLIYLLMGDHISGMWKSNQNTTPKNDSVEIAYEDDKKSDVVDGIHVASGLKYGTGYSIVQASCLSCHSSKLITQNRANAEGWKQMIRWMQETQGLPDLGEKEKVIIDYLAKYYAPEKRGRRSNLEVEEIEWYVLNLEE